jgi:Putative lumazine-binding
MLGAVATRPLLLALAACVLVGCSDDGPSDQENVRATLERFQRATEARDYRALCDEILAPKLVESVKRLGVTCEVALAKGFEDVREPRLAIGSITVRGDSANARVRSSAAGQDPSDDTIELVRVDGEWRVASLTAGASATP